ncbi:hypothetical protein [Alicyclobacillus sendaiensis]|uniref:hypothetical protein n=1 Tax=Alicyclobacillus sendaiensis TaxID=192387 RepID=UPI001FE090C5|nr:hypothetical protein [Alicyclobacillus sendaiensis]
MSTFADRLRQMAARQRRATRYPESVDDQASQAREAEESGYESRRGEDLQEALLRNVCAELESDEAFMNRMRSTGDTWINVRNRIEQLLPDLVVNTAERAHQLVSSAMNELFGKNGWKTESRPQKKNPERSVTWIVLVEPGDE